MKSHELAQKLLSMPDLDLYTEVAYLGNPSWEFKTVKFDGNTKITPEGLFLEPARFFVKESDFLSPNDEPVIGSYMIFFSDGDIIKEKLDDTRSGTSTVKYMSTGESRTYEYDSHNMELHDNHHVYHRAYETNIVLVTNRETYEEKPLYSSDDTNYEHRYIEDIDYVKVLVSYDPVSWEREYSQMTYAQAVKFGKELKQG